MNSANKAFRSAVRVEQRLGLIAQIYRHNMSPQQTLEHVRETIHEDGSYSAAILNAVVECCRITAPLNREAGQRTMVAMLIDEASKDAFASTQNMSVAILEAHLRQEGGRDGQE